MITLRTWIAVGVAAIAFISLAVAQVDLNPKNRQELKREDMAGTNMEVIISVVEAQPGEILARHIHHGEEAFYVLQGATLETPDGKQVKLATGPPRRSTCGIEGRWRYVFEISRCSRRR
jgi:mannose-6-phosphate isomerase-like protein (cupin superfamily)